MATKYSKLPLNITNGHKIYHHHLPSQDPPEFTQIGIFGFKICHLATPIIGIDDKHVKEFPRAAARPANPFI
jgi:hypothetical protein